MSPTSAERPDLLPPARKLEVEEQLLRITKSAAFSASPRCQQLLMYVVRQSIAGSYELLKERVVGAEVFGRDAAYDTGGDSIVRVRANDLRKRLAQYYDGAPGRDREIRIHLPTGSYVPEFSFPSAAPDAQTAAAGFRAPVDLNAQTIEPRRTPWRRVWLALAAVLVIGAVSAALYRSRPLSPTDKFWSPFLTNSQPVLFCLGHAQVFTLSSRFREEYFRKHPPSAEPEPRSVQFQPGDNVAGEDLVSVQGQFVGVGGAQSVQMLSSFLAARGKSSTLRIGSDLSFADLRTYPTVLIGAFSNRWTLQLNRDLRFHFDESTGEQILDRQHPGTAWKLERDGKGRELVDYAVVTRLLHSETGQVVVEASGITQYGCRAAGELIASNALLEKSLAGAPKGWEGKNLQMVLRSKIVGMTAGAPEVLSTYFW